ncbi:MAG: hypothetical protein KGR48_10605 [Alphaproteobacteria bacterium]|nr:hypothetical protein [Alphaproteobacteria bacterium]MDE2072266.1 hypothetical protein [Alphaproteobacteria bacterium]MDE2350642.1 hypothetical protein [Alphaproteobacteria bacterium]
MRAVLMTTFFALAAQAAWAGTVPSVPPVNSPQDIAATKVHNQNLVSQTQGADGVFVVEDDGTVKHVQSGMVCPAKFPNLALWHVEVFATPTKGYDVGCDYGRNDAEGHWAAKLTIFATKAPAGATLDTAFDDDRKGVLQVSPDARSLGPALDLTDGDKNTAEALPEWRSEAFLIVREGRQYTDQLVVSVVAGWIFEIRATYRGAPGKIVVTKADGPQAAVLAFGDRLMSTLAFVRVSRTLGK